MCEQARIAARKVWATFVINLVMIRVTLRPCECLQANTFGVLAVLDHGHAPLMLATDRHSPQRADLQLLPGRSSPRGELSYLPGRAINWFTAIHLGFWSAVISL
jgi:hypothetical protein